MGIFSWCNNKKYTGVVIGVTKYKYNVYKKNADIICLTKNQVVTRVSDAILLLLNACMNAA